MTQQWTNVSGVSTDKIVKLSADLFPKAAHISAYRID
jgi:hypothetical protein